MEPNELTNSELMNFYTDFFNRPGGQESELFKAVEKEMLRRITSMPTPKGKATEAAFFDAEHSAFAHDAKVTVPKDWRIFKGNREIKWADKDMLNFVGISISKDEAYLKKLLEEYQNA
jgi:hypothetical protein